MLSQYNNNCYFTSFIHLLSLTGGEWKCVKYPKIEIVLKSLQNNNITPIIDKLAISIFNETKTHDGPDFVNTTKKLFIDKLGLHNELVVFENEVSKISLPSKKYYITSDFPNNTGLENPTFVDLVNCFNPFDLNQVIKIGSINLRVLGFTISTGSHNFTIARKRTPIYEKFCSINPLDNEIKILSDDKMAYLLYKIQTCEYNIEFYLYEKC